MAPTSSKRCAASATGEHPSPTAVPLMTRRLQARIALPLSLSTTSAQLRPAAPCTPPPGCAPAPAHVMAVLQHMQRAGCGARQQLFIRFRRQKRSEKGGGDLRRKGTGPAAASDACCSLGRACKEQKIVGQLQLRSLKHLAL